MEKPFEEDEDERRRRMRRMRRRQEIRRRRRRRALIRRIVKTGILAVMVILLLFIIKILWGKINPNKMALVGRDLIKKQKEQFFWEASRLWAWRLQTKMLRRERTVEEEYNSN